MQVSKSMKELLDSHGKGMEMAIRMGLLDSSQKAYKKARSLTPVRTGNLRDSWRIMDLQKDRRFLETVYSQGIYNDEKKAPYGKYVENGHFSSKGNFVPGSHMTLKTKNAMESENVLQESMNLAIQKVIHLGK